MNRPTSRVAAVAVALVLLLAVVGYAQTPNCGVLQASTDRGLPNFSGTLPPSADLTTAGGSTWLYVLTQWGFARANLTNPANPGPYQLFNVGKYHGNGGVIPVVCDCHQGSNTMAVAQAPDGTARMISDWQPFKQGGPTSGLPAQLAQASGGGAITFGQQIDLGPNTNYTVPLGSRIAAVLLPNGSYYGYFPTENFGVKKANLTSPTGSISADNAIPVSDAIGWNSDTVISYAHVNVPGYADKYILVGTTSDDDTIHVAEINTSNGNLTEVAQGALLGTPANMEISAVNGHIFIFSAEFAGLQVYEYLFGTGQITHKATIAGNFKKVIVRGPQPFPALLGHRQVGGLESWIDFYNTNWLTEGGSPVTIKSLKHKGASGITFLGQGFETLVTQNGPTLTAYLYREIATSPEASIHTDQVDISCIAADPTAPPIPSATMTNLSAATRTSPENGKNYFGDKWNIKDSSFSFLPITELDWDFHYVAPFAAEKIANPPGSYADFDGYWPCDLLNGGEIFSGNGCYASLGTITSNYQLALRSENANPPDGQTVHLAGGASPPAAGLDRRLRRKHALRSGGQPQQRRRERLPGQRRGGRVQLDLHAERYGQRCGRHRADERDGVLPDGDVQGRLQHQQERLGLAGRPRAELLPHAESRPEVVQHHAQEPDAEGGRGDPELGRLRDQPERRQRHAAGRVPAGQRHRHGGLARDRGQLHDDPDVPLHGPPRGGQDGSGGVPVHGHRLRAEPGRRRLLGLRAHGLRGALRHPADLPPDPGAHVLPVRRRDSPARGAASRRGLLQEQQLEPGHERRHLHRDLSGLRSGDVQRDDRLQLQLLHQGHRRRLRERHAVHGERRTAPSASGVPAQLPAADRDAEPERPVGRQRRRRGDVRRDGHELPGHRDL